MGKKKSLKIGSYLRELSIVIIGVAVTLYVGNLVNNVKEKKDLKAQLATIYDELQDNLTRVDALINFYKDHDLLQRLVIEYIENPSQANNDSIVKYTHIIGKIPTFLYKKGAYETFLNSGSMKLLNDRKLLIDITESYLMLEATKEDCDKYTDMKLHEIMKLYELDPTIIRDNIDIRQPYYRGIFNFFLSIMGKAQYPEATKVQIERVLSRI